MSHLLHVLFKYRVCSIGMDSSQHRSQVRFPEKSYCIELQSHPVFQYIFLAATQNLTDQLPGVCLYPARSFIPWEIGMLPELFVYNLNYLGGAMKMYT